MAPTSCRQSGGGKFIGQKSAEGDSNSKATANTPSSDLRAARTRQEILAPEAALISKICWPLGSLVVISSKPPWAFTTNVNASMVTVLPSSSRVSSSKRICSKTRSLLRRAAESVRGLKVLHHPHGPECALEAARLRKALPVAVPHASGAAQSLCRTNPHWADSFPTRFCSDRGMARETSPVSLEKRETSRRGRRQKEAKRRVARRGAPGHSGTTQGVELRGRESNPMSQSLCQKGNRLLDSEGLLRMLSKPVSARHQEDYCR